MKSGEHRKGHPGPVGSHGAFCHGAIRCNVGRTEGSVNQPTPGGKGTSTVLRQGGEPVRLSNQAGLAERLGRSLAEECLVLLGESARCQTPQRLATFLTVLRSGSAAAAPA